MNMSNNTTNTNKQTQLLQNLKDLDAISKKMLNEVSSKNAILKGGINSCKSCQSNIHKNQSKIK